MRQMVLWAFLDGMMIEKNGRRESDVISVGQSERGIAPEFELLSAFECLEFPYFCAIPASRK